MAELKLSVKGLVITGDQAAEQAEYLKTYIRVTYLHLAETSIGPAGVTVGVKAWGPREWITFLPIARNVLG